MQGGLPQSSKNSLKSARLCSWENASPPAPPPTSAARPAAPSAYEGISIGVLPKPATPAPRHPSVRHARSVACGTARPHTNTKMLALFPASMCAAPPPRAHHHVCRWWRWRWWRCRGSLWPVPPSSLKTTPKGMCVFVLPWVSHRRCGACCTKTTSPPRHPNQPRCRRPCRSHARPCLPLYHLPESSSSCARNCSLDPLAMSQRTAAAAAGSVPLQLAPLPPPPLEAELPSPGPACCGQSLLLLLRQAAPAPAPSTRCCRRCRSCQQPGR